MYRVLIADDDDAIRRLLKKVCEALRWDVDLAEDGRRAIELLYQSSHDIFVVDVNMPGPSGLILAREIFKQEPNSAVIILTGYAEIGHAVQAMKEGVFDYIQKDENADFDNISRLLLRAASYRDSKRLTATAQSYSTQEADVRLDHCLLREPLLKTLRILVFLARSDDGRIVDCNTAAESLGYTQEELLGSSMIELVPDWDFSEWGSIAHQVERLAFPLVLEKPLLHKKRISEPFEWTLKSCPISDAPGVLILAKSKYHYTETQHILNQDRIIVEAKLELFSHVLNGMKHGVLLTDSCHRILFFNTQFLQDWQIPPAFLQSQDALSRLEELIGISIHETLQAFPIGMRYEDCQIKYQTGSSGTVVLSPLIKDDHYIGARIQVIPAPSESEVAEEDVFGKQDTLLSLKNELRAPVKELLKVTENLRQTSLDSEQSHWLDVQQHCLESLGALIG